MEFLQREFLPRLINDFAIICFLRGLLLPRLSLHLDANIYHPRYLTCFSRTILYDGIPPPKFLSKQNVAIKLERTFESCGAIVNKFQVLS